MKIKLSGFSIVEFLIAIGLGALVVTGVITVYVSNKSSTNIHSALAELNNNGRFTSYITNKYIRMAGYQGCTFNDNMAVVNIVSPGHTDYDQLDFTNPIFGYEGSTGTFSPALPGYLSGRNIRANTDVIEVRFAEDVGIRLLNDLSSPSDALDLTDPDGDGDFREGIAQSDIFFVTDCQVGDLVAAGGSATDSSISISPAENIQASFSKSYTRDARVYRYRYAAFYVRDTGRTNASNQPVFALYMLDANGNETEISEGVDDLQIDYGIDTDNDGSADTYNNANTVNTGNQWGDVVGVKVNRLLSTVDEVDSENRAYLFNGSSSTPSDRRMRRQWNNFISIRNRSMP